MMFLYSYCARNTLVNAAMNFWKKIIIVKSYSQEKSPEIGVSA